jgi:hypothetical protein
MREARVVQRDEGGVHGEEVRPVGVCDPCV